MEKDILMKSYEIRKMLIDIYKDHIRHCDPDLSGEAILSNLMITKRLLRHFIPRNDVKNMFLEVPLIH